MFCLNEIFIIFLFSTPVWGIENKHNNDFLKFIDPTIDPCDDFYKFTCGNFDKYYSLRNDNDQIVDNFQLVERDLLKIVNEIITRPIDFNEPIPLKKIKHIYKACIGDGRLFATPELVLVDKFGGLPMLNLSDGIDFTWNDLGTVVAQSGVPLIFDFIIQPHYFNASTFFLYFSKDTLVNPSLIRPETETDYETLIEKSLKEFSRSDKSVRRTQTQQPFDVFLRKLIGRMVQSGNPQVTKEKIDEDIENMRKFMQHLYNGGIVEDNVTLVNISMMTTVGDLQNWTKAQFGNSIKLNWFEYLNNVFSLSGVEITEDINILYSNNNFNVYLYGILNLLRQTDPRIVKNFALLRVLLYMAPDSDSYIRNAFEDYYRAKGYQLYPRWEYCTRKILDATGTPSFSFAATYDYERYHFDIDKIGKAKELVMNIAKRFRQTVHNSDWIDDKDIPKALRKLDKILMLLGYPQFINDRKKLDEFYRKIRICGWDGYGNAQRIRAFKQAYIFSQLGKARDRSFWDRSPFLVNAYYNRANNRIVLPIAMLHDNFFNGNLSVYDYGRIGCVIGHEITHGFDSEGRKYNEEGVLSSWWSNKTTTQFTNRTKCFIDQYNQYYIDQIDAYVDGKSTLNENLADNGGLRDCFKAYLDVKNSNESILIGNYTDEQLFFISYGTMWCSIETDYYLRHLNQNYPPNRFRVNGAVSNSYEFSKAFNCPVGTNMNPQKKCILW